LKSTSAIWPSFGTSPTELYRFPWQLSGCTKWSQAISEVVIDEIKKEVQISAFAAILLDESCDITCKSQLSTVFRYTQEHSYSYSILYSIYTLTGRKSGTPLLFKNLLSRYVVALFQSVSWNLLTAVWRLARGASIALAAYRKQQQSSTKATSLAIYTPARGIFLRSALKFEVNNNKKLQKL
jgi:hypothetical protein